MSGSGEMTCGIRAARAEDGGCVIRLAKALTLTFAVREDSFAANLQKVLSSESAFFRVAEVGGAVVGYVLGVEYVSLIANGPVVWVEELIVDEAYRRRGIGRALMDAACAWAASRGCRKIALATSRAGPFYKSIGFEESARYFREVLGSAGAALET